MLQAVLTLLCTRWSRVTDDRLRLEQLLDVIAETGVTRRYDLKTVGRALADLAADGLIVYRPARGRGRHASVAIADRFVADIETLNRDPVTGRVIAQPTTDRAGRPHRRGRATTDSVTFSDTASSYSQNHYPPTPHTTDTAAAPTRRPNAVMVHHRDVQTVLSAMPQTFRDTPGPVRQRLTREIRRYLAAGWLPAQILDVLAAPLPDDVHRPWLLAQWRLRRNMLGAGPRLAVLQKAWDQRETDQRRRADTATVTRLHAEVIAATDAGLRAQVLRALGTRLQITASDSTRALAHAARMARREFPQISDLGVALRRWIHHASDTPADQAECAPDRTGGGAPDESSPCVSCAAAPGIARPQLPIPELSVVCETCWQQLADPDLVQECA